MEDKLTMIRIKLEDRKYINDISLELGIVQTDIITMIIEAYKKSLKWEKLSLEYLTSKKKSF